MWENKFLKYLNNQNAKKVEKTIMQKEKQTPGCILKTGEEMWALWSANHYYNKRTS